jgi:hypothetical protein
VKPGNITSAKFTLTDPTSRPLTVNISSSTYRMTGSKLVTGVSSPGHSTYINLADAAGPIPPGTDLLVVREYYPFNSWYNSTISPYYANDVTRLRLQVFNWVDANHDGVVQYNEVALVNTNYAWANTEEARVSSPLTKLTGIPVLGVYQNPNLESYWFGVSNSSAKPLPFSVTLYYYQKTPWQTVSFDRTALQLTAAESATFSATLKVPANATGGTYEGMINLRSSTGQATQVPVSYVVPIAPATKGVPYVFGGNSSGDGVLYSNGATYGATDFAWRYESGNWRAYQVQVADSTVNQGTVKVQWTSPMTSINLFVLDPQGRIIGSSVPPGLYKTLTRNGIQALPLAPSPSNDYLQCPVSFNLFIIPCPGWAGGFAPSQNDGPNSSILQFPVNQTGTYTVVVHNTVYSGLTPFERFVGEVELNTIAPISSPPTLTVTAPTAPVKGTVPVTVDATGEGPLMTELTVDMNQPMVAHSGHGTFWLDTGGLSDGPHLVVVTATNEVGYTAQKSFPLLVLRTPPTVVIGNPVNGSTVSGVVAVAFFAKTPYPGNVSASIDGTKISTSSGSYSWNSAAVPDGEHALVVNATDQAGNVGTATSHFFTNNQAQTTGVRNLIIETGAISAAGGALVAALILRMRVRSPRAPPTT